MRSTFVALAGIASLLGLAGAAGAQAYRWVDERGGIHYTQTPPPPAALPPATSLGALVDEVLDATGARRAIAQIPGQVQAGFQASLRRNIDWAYEMQGNIEKALEWFRKAVEVNPNHWRAYLGVGDAAARLRRVDEAVAAWRQALALNPDDAETHAELGRLLVAVGQKSEGIREVQTAVRLDPSRRREREFLNRELGRDPDNGLRPFSAR
jgi:tetratricopeptide (TPR) repeat protein